MKKNIFIIILAILVLGLGGYLVYDKVIDKDVKEEVKEESGKQEEENKEITLDDLYGTYTWEKSYGSGTNMKYKVTLVLNSDGTAAHDASTGLEHEATRGSYVYKDGKIIYTREYFNYYQNDNDGVYEDEEHKTETFIVIDKNTLQNTYYNQQTSLKKE